MLLVIVYQCVDDTLTLLNLTHTTQLLFRKSPIHNMYNYASKLILPHMDFWYAGEFRRQKVPVGLAGD